MTAGREVNSTMFAFSPPIMMASYCSKCNKVVLMASSIHQDDKVAEEEPTSLTSSYITMKQREVSTLQIKW